MKPASYNTGDARLDAMLTRQAKVEAERQMQEKREAERLAARQHQAWLRLCGSVAPIGRLAD